MANCGINSGGLENMPGAYAPNPEGMKKDCGMTTPH